MKISMRASALLAVAVAAVVLSTYIPAAGQTVQTKTPPPAAKTGPVPRTADGQPDLSGFWNMGALRYGGNLAMGKEAEVPYTDAGRAAYKNHDAKDDPTGFCQPPGMPRMLHSPFPMMVMQDKNHVAFLYEYMRIWRLIDLNRTQHYPDVEDTYFGDSIGKWEGDTLVIDTVGINDRSWLDTAGHQHSADMRVVERITRTGPEAMDYEVTVIDPKMYATPWVHKGTLRPQKATKGLPELLEYFCTDHNIDTGHLVSTKPTDAK
jgi:hypothetical protein